MTAPVALISFNRPDATRRTLERIREAAPSELFLIADGPRPDHEDDLASCEEVRRELDVIDWQCQVHRRYNDQNRGIDATIELGLDWVFEHVGEAIILEDDCVPNADFFRFCTELLDYYRDVELVWHIASRAPTLPDEVFGGSSYAFAGFGPIWGWATWRRAWSSHRRRFPRLHQGPPPPPAEVHLAGSHLRSAKGRRYFADVARDPEGNAFRWDSHWCLSEVCARGMVAIPRSNLTENIGFGERASNTRTVIGQRELESVQWPLVHPAEITISPQIELLCERLAAAHHGRLARFAARLLSQEWLRDMARPVVRAWREWRVPVR